jgi:hypothetical protein
MAKSRRATPSGGVASTRIPIYSLSSGVSTQPPSKRLPLEAEVLDNVLISLERSAEKRPGFEILPQNSFSSTIQQVNENRLDLFRLEETFGSNELKDIFWFWFTLNENNRFLVGIDYKAKANDLNPYPILFYIYKIENNSWVDLTPTSNIEKTQQDTTIVKDDTRKYITYGNSTNKAKNVLVITTLGSSLVVLNKLVKAGFTSGTDGFSIDLDGSILIQNDSQVSDTLGPKITYYTSTRIAGSTGSLETNTQETYITNFPLTGNALPTTLTISLPVPSNLGDNSNIVFCDNTTPGSLTADPTATTHSRYFTGLIDEVYNNDQDNLTFENTPTAYKSTTTTSITGNGLEGKTITGIVPTTAIPAEIAVPVVGTSSGQYANTTQQNLNYHRILIWIDQDKYFTGLITGVQRTPSLALNIKVDYVSAALKTDSTAHTTSKNIAYECCTININYTSSYLSAINTANSNWKVFWGTYTPVEDFKYKDSAQPWLGQSFADFSEIRFPPDPVEVYANNSNIVGNFIVDSAAKSMLASLYDSTHPLNNQTTLNGRGKILYTAGPYLSQSSGYYRVINFPDSVFYKDGTTNIQGTGRPYTKKVRSPDYCSVIDKKRMPQKLTFNESPEGINQDWLFSPVEWEERTSGDRTNNPGPSVFLDSNKNAVHKRINSIVSYRDRLFFAVDDTVFTTQLGNFENLFLQDPSNIVSSDPIDIKASAKTYAEISNLTPFNDFLFINTKADIQFELRGAENQITPLTAQIQPTTFYSTAKFTEPLLMGSLIYFLSPNKLYMYISQTQAALSSAEDISTTCIGYLPENFKTACVSPANNTISFVDEDNPNYLYMYTNRISTEKMIQNAYYRYILDSGIEIETMQTYDNYLHCVVKRNNFNGGIERYILKTYLGKLNKNIPRIDNYFTFTIYDNNTRYNTSTNQTSFDIVFPYTIDPTKVIIILNPNDSLWGENKYTILKPTYTRNSNGIGYTFTVNGNYKTNGATVLFGNNYLMNIELSPQFVRDDSNNVIDGVLNLKTLCIRHADTGNYDVIATRRERSILKSSFNALLSNSYSDVLSIENTQKSGEFIAKILGFSDTTKVQIVSEYPTPVNIVNMEFKGKFKQSYTSLNT